MKVTLRTASGEFVATKTILPFTEYPEALLWGNRLFVKTAPGDYKEVFFSMILSD